MEEFKGLGVLSVVFHLPVYESSHNQNFLSPYYYIIIVSQVVLILYYVLVDRCLATKVLLAKLPAVGWLYIGDRRVRLMMKRVMGQQKVIAGHMSVTAQ